MLSTSKTLRKRVAVAEAQVAARKKAKAAKAQEVAPVPVWHLEIREMKLILVGDSPLISHAWSQKAKQEMLDKQMKKAAKGKKAKDPKKDYEDSLYIHPDGGYGFPSIAFKCAAVTACSQIDGLTKVQTRGSFHVEGEMLKINGTPQMREDMVRIGMGVADIRYRGEFPEWSVEVPIRYNAQVLSPEQIANLFNVAGFAVGIGEWRPERNGSYGLFHVGTEKEVKRG